MKVSRSATRVTLFSTLVALALAAWAAGVPPGTNDDIRARLEPFGSLCKAGQDCGVAAAASTGPLTGDAVYDKFCFACHAQGVGGAPKLGDAAEWAPRIDKGMDALMVSTLNGLNAMPPKGTYMSCSDDELEAAVNYMLEATE